MVAAGAGRIEELTATEGGPGVDPDDEAGWGAAGEELVDQLGDRRTESGPVAPLVELTGQPLDLVERRVAPIGLVIIARRQVDPERPLVGVA